MEARTDADLSRFSRLLPGRHGLPREFVAEHQRRRLLAAMADLVSKRGYRNTALTRICSAAGVARNTFYEHFDSKEECFLATFDDGVEQARSRIAAAIEPGPWEAQVSAGMTALLELIIEQPALARTCLVESQTAGPAAIERYELTIRSLVSVLQVGREGDPREIPDAMEETIVRGLASMLYQRLVLGETDRLAELLPEMLEFALAPYLGDVPARQAAEAASLTTKPGQTL